MNEFQAQNNKQAYLAFLNKMGTALPEPRTTEEALLYKLCNEGVGGGGADWNASEGEDGYVKNRTHWSETSTELRTLTLDATSEDHGSVNDIDVARAIFEDPSCAVLTLLGTEYNIGDYPYEDNHYERRYIIVKGTYDDKYFSVSLKDGVPTSRIAYNNFYCGGAEVRVMVTTENVHKLDKKFLPDDVGGGGGADWNASEGEDGYVKNRTHYETEEIVNEPLNITWDGNTEGLVSVGDMFYKVSDLVLTDEQIKSATIVVGGEQLSIASAWDNVPSEYITDEFVAPLEFVMFVRKDGAIFNEMITFPECGIYFINTEGIYPTSLTTTEPVEQTKTVVHKLDKKYLPDDIGGGSGGGAEIIEATVNTTYTRTLDLPITTTEIMSKVASGQDVIIKAPINHDNTDYTAFFKVVSFINDTVFFSAALPTFTSSGANGNVCYLTVYAETEGTTAEYRFAT